MKPKVSVYGAASLDGFIACADGALDWLKDPGAPAGEDGIGSFMASVAALVVGRQHFEQVLRFDACP